jgi:hypothetical protein
MQQSDEPQFFCCFLQGDAFLHEDFAFALLPQHMLFAGTAPMPTGKTTSSDMYTSRQRDNMNALNFKIDLSLIHPKY